MTKKFKKQLKKMLESKESRLILYLIMLNSGTFRHGFVPGDSHATSFHAGQRSVGLMIYDWIMNSRPDIFPVMQKEYREEISSELQKKEDQEIYEELLGREDK